MIPRHQVRLPVLICIILLTLNIGGVNHPIGSFDSRVHQHVMGPTSLPQSGIQPTPLPVPVNSTISHQRMEDSQRKRRGRNRERRLFNELATLLVTPNTRHSVSRAQLLELALNAIKHHRSCPNYS